MNMSQFLTGVRKPLRMSSSQSVASTVIQVTAMVSFWGKTETTAQGIHTPSPSAFIPKAAHNFHLVYSCFVHSHLQPPVTYHPIVIINY